MILDTYDEPKKPVSPVKVVLKMKKAEVPAEEAPKVSEEKKPKKKKEDIAEATGSAFEIPEAEMTRISKYLQAHRNSADPVHKRLTALLSLSEGASFAKVSANLGVSGSTVKEWKDRYQKRGLNGLMSMKYYRWKK